MLPLSSVWPAGSCRKSSENFFCKITAFRRIATRYEKTDACFAAMVYAVNIVITTI
jgi:transposase